MVMMKKRRRLLCLLVCFNYKTRSLSLSHPDRHTDTDRRGSVESRPKNYDNCCYYCSRRLMKMRGMSDKIKTGREKILLFFLYIYFFFIRERRIFGALKLRRRRRQREGMQRRRHFLFEKVVISLWSLIHFFTQVHARTLLLLLLANKNNTLNCNKHACCKLKNNNKYNNKDLVFIFNFIFALCDD